MCKKRKAEESGVRKTGGCGGFRLTPMRSTTGCRSSFVTVAYSSSIACVMTATIAKTMTTNAVAYSAAAIQTEKRD